METKKRGKPSESKLRLEENIAFARSGLGLYRPTDLRQALKAIQEGLPSTHTIYDSLEATPYFLGHEVACQVWGSSEPVSLLAPFAFLEQMRPLEAHNIVQIGCPSVTSFDIGRKFLSAASGDTLPKQTIIELSPLAATRFRHSRAAHCEIINADASTFPLGEIRPDLIISDLLISEDTGASRRLMENISRGLAPGGRFLTRICLLPDSAADSYFELMDMAGLFWNGYCRRIYGADYEGRDGYLGLTLEQWDELGQMYALFIRNNFYGPNRFQTEAAVRAFLASFPKLTLENLHREEQPLTNSGSLAFLSVDLRKAGE